MPHLVARQLDVDNPALWKILDAVGVGEVDDLEFAADEDILGAGMTSENLARLRGPAVLESEHSKVR